MLVIGGLVGWVTQTLPCHSGGNIGNKGMRWLGIMKKKIEAAM